MSDTDHIDDHMTPPADGEGTAPADGDSARHTVTRRRVLRASGAGLGALSFGGRTAATEDTRGHIVGTGSEAAFEAAKGAADEVYRLLDFGDIGRAVAGMFSEEARRQLGRRDDVRYVEEDGRMEALAQTLPWGVDRVDADVARSNGFTGQGADVAILDSGIDEDHPDLEDNVDVGKAFARCGDHCCDERPCSDLGNCNRSWSDDDDHGSHVSGIVAAVDDTEDVVGVAPEVTLHSIKVLDCEGFGSFSGIAEGIEHVANRGWDVGNLSLGSTFDSQTVRDACQFAHDNGVLLVAAAGNEGPCSDCVDYPAKYSTVMAVSATDINDGFADFSSRGPEVEIAAPGVDVLSTVIGGTDTFSGTSMAAPHVSAAGGMLMAEGLTNAEARDRLRNTAEDIGLPSNEQGNGLLDVEAALSFGTAGTVTTDQPDAGAWHAVDLDRSYGSPVVIASPPTYNGRQPAHVRVRGVGDGRFEFSIEEWTYLDGVHRIESVGYVAIEAGTHELPGGATIQAGETTADHEWTDVEFHESFDATPVVFSQPQTVNGGHPVIARQTSVTADGFRVRLQEEEGLDGVHREETVGYVAVERGIHGVLEAETTSRDVTHRWSHIAFDRDYDDAPLFVGQLQTDNGGQPGSLRCENVDADGVDVFVQEERSRDREVRHRAERVGYLAIAEAGPL